MTPDEIKAALDERKNIKARIVTDRERVSELTVRLAQALAPDTLSGTVHGVFDGNEFTAKFPETLTVDEVAIESVLAVMPIGSCDKIILRTYKLDKREYNKMMPHLKTCLDQALILKPGTLSLEISETPLEEAR